MGPDESIKPNFSDSRKGAFSATSVARAILGPWSGKVAFDLTATVTCVIPCETKSSFVTISDRSGDVFVTVPDSVCPSSYSPGDLVRIIGSTRQQSPASSLAKGRSLAVLTREQLGHVKAELKTAERTRLAVELHDTLAQNLTGVSMEIEAANELRGNAPPEMLAHIGIAAKALKSCRDKLRNCLWDLRSQALEEADMNRAILKTLQPHVNDSRVSVRFNVARSKITDNTACRYSCVVFLSKIATITV